MGEDTDVTLLLGIDSLMIHAIESNALKQTNKQTHQQQKKNQLYPATELGTSHFYQGVSQGKNLMPLFPTVF